MFKFVLTPAQKTFLIRWMGFSLILHLIAGFRSVGFYDFDEHFQILEFLSYQLGRTPVLHLPPEFLEQDRSWFLPSFYELLVRICLSFGITSPSTWAATLRIFSSLVGWFSLCLMSLCAWRWFTSDSVRKWAVRLTTLLYFLPYLHSRTASENLSGSLFFISLALLTLRGCPSLLSAVGMGVLLGTSFLFRFQMGFMIAGFLAWSYFIGKFRFSRLMGMGTGIIAIILLGVVVDYRGYGSWTFTAWNYLNIAVIQKKAALSGVFPWWSYFQFLNGDVPLIGNLISIAVIVAWIARPFHILTFSTAPYFLAHVFLAHKEPRYLFPLISGVPTLVTLGYETLWGFFVTQMRISGRILKSLAWGVVVLNLGGLVVATLKPAAVQPLLHDYLFQHQTEIQKLYYLEKNPFEVIGLQIDFYRPPHLSVIPAVSWTEIQTRLKTSSEPLWVYATHFELPETPADIKKHCQLQYSVFPNWMKTFLFLPGIRMSSNKGSVFKCTF